MEPPTLKPRILVVDDITKNLQVVGTILRNQGYEVMPAASGVDALKSVRAQLPDLILLDLMMPEMDGLEVCRRLKTDSATRQIPIIFLTASNEMEHLVTAFSMGAVDFVTKPFNPSELLARVRTHVELQQARARLREEKKRSDDMLRTILPPDVADELQATGRVQPRRFESVGVLFCDLVGFTAYCDQHPPEEIVEDLQHVVEGFEDLAAKHGLEKIKTIGDAFMATAGLRTPLSNPAWNCVQCARDMIATARRLPTQWQVRVGLHVGPVVAGVVGRRKYQYDVWGDTVNLAARMQEAAQPGSICVTGQTWRLLSAQCQGIALGSVDVKGKGRLELFRIEPQPETLDGAQSS